jgi:hypothetical protein
MAPKLLRFHDRVMTVEVGRGYLGSVPVSCCEHYWRQNSLVGASLLRFGAPTMLLLCRYRQIASKLAPERRGITNKINDLRVFDKSQLAGRAGREFFSWC